jgi:penicillin-insensitive murein endopeptidase
LGGVNDGTSLSRGAVNGGRLENGVRLAKQGDGYLIPPLWQARGNNFGTDELVSAIVRTARRLSGEFPGTTLYVADLSPERGGRTQWHRSHQSGRDVDLIFFIKKADGTMSGVPSGMVRFGPDGKPLGGAGFEFDVAKNWALVRTLLEDPGVDVQYLFVSSPLRQMLLDHAAAQGEPKPLVDRAAAVMTQPAEALPHDDHFHLRIYCAKNDLELGCKDRGPLRWFKKTYKYLRDRALVDEQPEPALAELGRPFCRLMGRSTFAQF